ncbi:MAG: reverse transcriptase-like protein [Methanophagales archaeon]|jgi:ribonuclease HI|nr:reverse transcriptase-like protein [Methanophagales archaeon]
MNGTRGEGTAIRKMMKKLIIYTDGACRGNPGPAGIGIVICNESGKKIKEDKEFIGNATNNIAEYRALIKALELASDFSVTRVECFSDSELMVRQLNGAYRVRDEKLHELFLRVREKARQFEEVTYSHVPRENNLIKRADKLANLGIDDKKSTETTDGEIEQRKEKEKAEVKGDEDAMSYYKKGKEQFFKCKHDLSPEHIREITRNLRKAIELNPRLWAPHYHLGSLFYLTGQYPKAKIEFEKALEKNIEPKYEQPIMYILGEIKRIESGYSFPKNLEGVKKMTSNSILLNHALIEWLENALRDLIQEVLSRKYGEEWWWEGVDINTRKECAERKQEAQLKEERKLSELLFIDFHTYAEIIEKKKIIFGPFIGKTEIDELID